MEEQIITVNLPFAFVVGEMGEQIGRPILTIEDAEEEVMLKLEYDDYEMFLESSIDKTMRVKAMEWWYFLDDLMKDILTEQYYGKERRFSSLTGREIEFMFKNEIQLERK